MLVGEVDSAALRKRIERGDSLAIVDAETADTWLVSGGRADRLGFEEASANRERIFSDRPLVVIGEFVRAVLYANNLVQQNFPRERIFILSGGREAIAYAGLVARHTGDEEVFPTVW